MSDWADHDSLPPMLDVTLASRLNILVWSYGRITSPKSLDRERDMLHESGLFSERIFGPVRDHECACGKFRGGEQAGIVCDECGVKVTSSSVRRQRMAHIELPVPVIHPWFYGHDSAPMELLLDTTHDQLTSLLDRRRFISLELTGPHDRAALCPEDAARSAEDSFESFLSCSGARAVQTLLQRMKFSDILQRMRDERENVTVIPSRRMEARCELLQAIGDKQFASGDLVIESLPVIPAGLRGIWCDRDGDVRLDPVSWRYARILVCCTTLERFQDETATANAGWPTGSEMRSLVDLERQLRDEIALLFDELLRFGSVASRTARPTDRRRKWPGRRVDFSARGVVVPDPSLRLFECRLPEKAVAAELLRPMPVDSIIYGNRRSRFLESEASKHPVVCSFPPVGGPRDVVALHPRLATDNAIHVHPLLATSLERTFAELDMVVHRPLSTEAQEDCDALSFPRVGLRDAVSGELRLAPAGEALIGCIYASWLSHSVRDRHARVIQGDATIRERTPVFASCDDVVKVWERGQLHLHDLIGVNLRRDQKLYRDTGRLCDGWKENPVDVRDGKRRVATTVGRAVLNSLMPAQSPYWDLEFAFKNMRAVLTRIRDEYGTVAVEKTVERLSEFGFRTVTALGLSLGLGDFRPGDEEPIRLELMKDIDKSHRYEQRGLIGPSERRHKIADCVHVAQDQLIQIHLEKMSSDEAGFHPLLAMLYAASTPPRHILCRLLATIGAFWTPWSNQLSSPVLSNFSRDLGPLDYFRLAAVDRQKRIHQQVQERRARALQRRIRRALADVVVIEEECGTRESCAVDLQKLPAEERPEQSACAAISGRCAAETIVSPITDEVIVAVNETITAQAAREIESCGLTSVRVRTLTGCQSTQGVCGRCYGVDDATGKLVAVGTSVGIRAAFALGVAVMPLATAPQRHDFVKRRRPGVAVADCEGVVSLRRLRVMLDRQGRRVVVSPDAPLEILDGVTVIEQHILPQGAVVDVAAGSHVSSGTRLASWNPGRIVICAQDAGTFHMEQPPSSDGACMFHIAALSGGIVDGGLLPGEVEPLVAEGAVVEMGEIVAESVAPNSARPPYCTRSPLERLESLLTLASSQDAPLRAAVNGRVTLEWNNASGTCDVVIHSPTDARPFVHRVDVAELDRVIARTGQLVEAGDPLTRGELSLREQLRGRSLRSIAAQLLREIRGALRSSAFRIPIVDRHWELLVARMLQFVRIESAGDSSLSVGQVMTRGEAKAANLRLRNMVRIGDPHDYPIPLDAQVVSRNVYEFAERRRAEERPDQPPPDTLIPWPAGWSQLLLGIDEIAEQGSPLTGAGFHPTRAGLVRAALNPSRRAATGMQESVLLGRLIPAGSGWRATDRKADPDDE